MTTTELTQRDTTTVDVAIVEEISLKHRVAQEAAGEAVRVAAETGELLAEVKAKLKHGEWEPWLAANFAGDATTARGYMRLAANRERVTDLPSVRQALKALSAPKEPTDDPASEPQGASFTAAYESMSPIQKAVFMASVRAWKRAGKSVMENFIAAYEEAMTREPDAADGKLGVPRQVLAHLLEWRDAMPRRQV
jgi:hypothetical protein